MAGVSPIGPVVGYVIENPEGNVETIQGGPANPAHANPFWQQDMLMPWQNIPIGPFPNAIDPTSGITDEGILHNYGSLPAGTLNDDPTADQQPITNAAPFPRESPALHSSDQLDVKNRDIGSSRQLIQSLFIHAQKTGASLKRLFTTEAQQDNWEGFFNPETGEDILPPVPASVSYQANGFGVNDHISNPYAKVNQYEFNTSHRHRRFAYGSIPGNSMWMKPGGRPMVRTLTSTPKFPLSGQFANNDPGATFGISGAILETLPQQYQAPLQPAIDNTPVNQEMPPVISFY